MSEEVRHEDDEIVRLIKIVETIFSDPDIVKLPDGISETLKEKALRAIREENADVHMLKGLLTDGFAALIKKGIPFTLDESLNDGSSGEIKTCACLKKSPVIAVMTGTSGVGKTVVMFKIATVLALKKKLKIVLVNMDDSGIVANRKVSVIAEIIGVPAENAFDKIDLPKIIEKHMSADVILIDSAGFSHRDNLKLLELKAFLDSLSHHGPLVFLVLQANVNVAESLAIAEKFKNSGANRIIFTKTDEVSGSFMPMLTVAGESKLPVSYICNGQNVPDDMIAFKREYIEQNFLKRCICGLDELDGLAGDEKDECSESVPQDAGAEIPVIKSDPPEPENHILKYCISARLNKVDPARLATVYNLLDSDCIEIQVGRQLEAAVKNMTGHVRVLRNRICMDTGYVMPHVSIRDNSFDCGPCEYLIRLKGRVAAKFAVEPDCRMVFEDPAEYGIKGIESHDPAFRIRAFWISAAEAGALDGKLPIYDASTIIFTHLEDVVKNNAGRLFGIRECRKMIEVMKNSNSELVEAIMEGPGGIGERNMLKLFKRLLELKVSLLNLFMIFEFIYDALPEFSRGVDYIAQRIKSRINVLD